MGIEQFVSSLGALISPGVLLMILIGVFIGYWVGILPGVGGIVTMALLLPVTVALPPFEALALLLSMYAVVTITGDLTAILIGVPGSAASAALVPDGYAMAKKGLATRAMSAAVLSSAFGAVLGAVLLFLAIPVMRPLVLALGAPQQFMLSVLGLAMVASLSGKSLLKGTAAAAIGVLLSTIGPAIGVGTIRFSFGELYLLDGLVVIPIAIGLFAIPELVDLHRTRTGIAREGTDTPESREGPLVALPYVWKRRWLMVRTSLLGAGVGAVPGLGGAVASWVGYGHAAQTSKDPEFGSGSIDGVIGPGAANNSKEGGGLIPTIAFGVPGTATMAVLLGAFIMLGITPGPGMVTRDLDLTYFMVWVLVVGNLLGACLALLTLKPLGRITFIKGTLLVPFVAAFVLIGSGAATGQPGDLVLVMTMGLLAWFMRVHGWPVVPLLLGFVLGDRIERSLSMSMRLHDFDWMTNPVVLVLLVGVIATLFIAVRTNRRRSYDLADHADRSRAGGLWSVLFALALLAVSLFAMSYASQWSFEARAVPMLMAGVAAVAIVAATAMELWRRYRPRAEPSDEPTAPAPATGDGRLAEDDGGPVDDGQPVGTTRRADTGAVTATGQKPGSVTVILLYLVGFATAMWAVGMTWTIGLFVVGYYRFSGGETWRRSLIAGVIGTIVYFLLFDLLLDVPAPRPALLG